MSLASVKCPVLVIAGRVDHIAPPRRTRQFRVYAPRAEFVTLEKSGHDTLLEEPARLIQVLAPFLAKERYRAFVPSMRAKKIMPDLSKSGTSVT
jgi:pimeloyl-ACP methyl ester carboxylesterase